jgi:cytochrome c oxidase subunit I
VATIGSFILVAGLLLFFANMVVALFRGKKAEQNPWGGVTLEWQIPTPPPLENFATIPTITHRPYAFNPENPR